MKTKTTYKQRNQIILMLSIGKTIMLCILLNIHAEAQNCNSSCSYQGNNLIVNGDFSEGAAGFNTDYINFTSDGSDAPQHYGITTNTFNYVADQWCNMNDHTTGTGHYMWVDGSDMASLTIWSQTITIDPNTDYMFSFYAANLSYTGAVDVYMNGSSIYTNFSLDSVSCQWLKFCYSFNSATNHSVSFAVKNTNIIYMGNDMAFDDFNLIPCTRISGIENLSYNNKPICFPNPAKDELIIQIDNSNGNTKNIISINNCLGQEVKQIKTNSLQTRVNTSDLQNGIYFIRLTQNGKNYTEKVIISK